MKKYLVKIWNNLYLSYERDQKYFYLGAIHGAGILILDSPEEALEVGKIYSDEQNLNSEIIHSEEIKTNI